MIYKWKIYVSLTAPELASVLTLNTSHSETQPAKKDDLPVKDLCICHSVRVCFSTPLTHFPQRDSACQERWFTSERSTYLSQCQSLHQYSPKIFPTVRRSRLPKKMIYTRAASLSQSLPQYSPKTFPVVRHSACHGNMAVMPWLWYASNTGPGSPHEDSKRLSENEAVITRIISMKTG